MEELGSDFRGIGMSRPTLFDKGLSIKNKYKWNFTFLEAKSLPVPNGKHGARLEVRYRLYQDNKNQVPFRVTVTEHIRVLFDPYNIARILSTGPDEAINGFFNDRYSLVSDDPLPNDFRFEFEQTYKANGQQVSGKNKLVYTSDSIMYYFLEGNQWRLRGRGSCV